MFSNIYLQTMIYNITLFLNKFEYFPLKMIYHIFSIQNYLYSETKYINEKETI
jgi:hypothetical protein